MWLDVIRYVLLLWGVIYLVTQSAIFAPFRVAFSRNRLLAVLIYCPSCFGTWVGFALAPLLPWGTPLAGVESGLVAMALGRVWGHLFGDNSVFENEHARHPWFIKEGNDAHVGGHTGGDAGD